MKKEREKRGGVWLGMRRSGQKKKKEEGGGWHKGVRGQSRGRLE